MKAIVLIFSPSGNTLKVGKVISEYFNLQGIDTQITDLTRNKDYLFSLNRKAYINKIINDKDLLFIGGPVYAHHLHYNVKEIIKQFEKLKNGNKQYAIPFVTYGGINSGIALHEAEKLLKKQNRTVIAGLKISAEHCLTKKFKTVFNENLPGDEILPMIDELVKTIVDLKNNNSLPNKTIGFLNYQKFSVLLKANIIFREKFWQKYMYPKIKFNYSNCNNCGKCVKLCPVQRYEMTEKGPAVRKNAKDCIHCGKCVFSCKREAITFIADWEKWEKMIEKAASGQGLLASNEFPRSKVFLYNKS